MVKASSFELARMLRQPLAIRFNRCSRLFAVSVKRMRMHLRSREFSTHTKCVSIVGTCQRQIALNVKAYGFGCLNRTNASATELYAVLVGEADCNY